MHLLKAPSSARVSQARYFPTIYLSPRTAKGAGQAGERSGDFSRFLAELGELAPAHLLKAPSSARVSQARYFPTIYLSPRRRKEQDRP
jgi:hypothetical protein